MRCASVFIALPFVLLGCDPDLNALKVPGDAGPDVQRPPVNDSGGAPPGDSGATQNDGGTDGSDNDAGNDAGPTGHVIDGTNDFSAGETFTTSSANYTGYVAWDAKSIYFGMSGDDIGLPASEKKWVLLYFGTGGTGGSTTGIDYNDGGNAASQQPTLPFSAQYHVRLKTDLSYVNGQSWSGSAWIAATGLVPDCEKKGTFVECRVARSALGSPTQLKMHVSMVKEQPGAEWTYAAVPSSSFVDGKDPNYTKYFEFNLDDATTAPNTYVAK